MSSSSSPKPPRWPFDPALLATALDETAAQGERERVARLAGQAEGLAASARAREKERDAVIAALLDDTPPADLMTENAYLGTETVN